MAKKKDEKVEESAAEIEESKTEKNEEIEAGNEEAETEKKKEKKVVRRRKTKEKENPLISAIRLTVESGKVDFGIKTGISALLSGAAKLYVVAENTPEEYQKKVFELAKKSNVPVIVFPGSTMELGAVCGKPFPVSVLSIYDIGNSNIMDYARK